ncbi:unnamed protein product, partial [marine sediment metagenome]
LINHSLVGLVIHAIPKIDKDFNNIPWEEWFFYSKYHSKLNRCEKHHVILFTKKHPTCTQEVDLPKNDNYHPRDVIGKKWYFYDDSNLIPLFLR